MEGFFLMKVILLSLICLTKCCSFSSPEACAPKRLSYGGRMLQVDYDGLGVLPNSWANRRVVIFRIPPSFLKRRHRGSVFGQKGIARIRKANDKITCADRFQEQCPWVANQNTGSCTVDPTAPCYKTPPSYSQIAPISFLDITPTSITVTWPAWDATVDLGHGPVVGYVINIRKLGEEAFMQVPTSYQLSHQFIDLEENTEYEFQLIVVRDHPFGEGPPSNIQKHMTCVLDDIHLQVSSISDEPGYASIFAEWSYSESVDSCLNIKEQIIIIHQLDRDLCKISHREPFQDVLDNVTRTYTKLRRRAYSVYNVTIVAKTPSGVYNQSKVMRTDTSRPTAVPHNLRLSYKSRNQNASILRWNYPTCGQRNGNIITFEYVFRRFSQPEERGRTTEKHMVLTSLQIDKPYSFQVRAVTRKGAGPFATFEEVF